MSKENETVFDILTEARDKYTVHNCSQCNWRKCCFRPGFDSPECKEDRQSIELAFGIDDGYFTNLLDRIEAAFKREISAEFWRSTNVVAEAEKRYGNTIADVGGAS